MSRRKSLFSLLALALALAARAQQPDDRVIARYREVLEKAPAEGTALDRLWQAYLEGGRTGEIIDEYRKPGTFTSEMVLGLLLRKAGRDEEAAAAFQRAAALDTANTLPLFALAKLHAEAGRSRPAAGVLEKIVAALPADDPRRVETLLQLGAAWLAAGELQSATDAWERAVALNPDDLELRRRLADSYAQNHLGGRALVHLEYIVAHAPPAERATALQQLARTHQGLGNQDAAIRALDSALALTTPGNWLRAGLQSQIIRLHQRYHRTAELEERWKQFAAANPNDAGGILQLIDLYERLGDLDQQRAWLKKLVGLVPRNADCRLKLARLYVQMDQPGAASVLFDQLIAEQPANADFIFERAKIDMQNDDAAAARQRIAALVAAKPNDEGIRGRALEFYEQNRLLDAVESHLAKDAAADSPDAVTALANFYFSQHRDAEALQTLEKLVRPADTAAQQAAAQVQIAQILKTQNNLTAAAAALAKAAQLRPDDRAVFMQLGELQAARGDAPAAQAACERAFTLSRTDAEAVDADRKLFDAMQTQAPHANPEVPAPDAASAPSPAVARRIEALAQACESKPTAPAWLRLARWRAWTHDAKGALTAAQSALDLDPQSVDAREFVVKILADEGLVPGAVSGLAKLAEIDPANAPAYRRRAGQLELQAGRTPEALAIFEGLVKSNPGNVEALTDLALTQQRADRSNDALATWREIYALSPVSKKKEALAQVLRMLERLDQHQQAAELMLKAIDTEAGEREQFAQFADLLAYCTKHDQLEWLRAAFEQRRKWRADDYFTEIALGRILKAMGNKAAAFEVLADASYAAPNQADSLPELVREAEEMRKLDAAVKLQTQLMRIVPQDKPDGLEKLAELQEKNFDLNEAAKTWDRIAAKFSRDAEALGHAVDFQVKWGAPARAAELLRKLRALDPANVRTLTALATLDLESGATAEAESCLEQVLKLAPAGKPEDPVHVPDLVREEANQIQTTYRSIVRQRGGHASGEVLTALRNFWVDDAAAAKGGRDLRCETVRRLAEIQKGKADKAALATWIARWRESGNAPGETLWALYFAGAGDAALDATEALMKRDAANAQLKNAFIWLALKTGQFARLGAWMQDSGRTTNDRDYLLVALGQYLRSHHGRLDPALVPSLFPEDSNARLWPAAKLFEQHGHLREAAALGRRYFDSLSTQQAACAPELALWHLQLGDVDAARTILRAAVRSPAESFDAPVYTALREYWLLLPPPERAAFTESYLAAIDRGAQPVHRAIAGVLLHALSGDVSLARADIERLAVLGPLAHLSLDDPGSSASRRWSFFLTAGTQLVAWKMEALAVFVWERALGDNARIELDGEAALDIAREMRRRLHALRIARADTPDGANDWITAYERSAPKDGMIQLAESLENAGAGSRAVMVYRKVWEEAPDNFQNLRNLLSGCRRAADGETAAAVLTRVLGEGLVKGNDGAQMECTLELADLMEREGSPERARAVLRDAMEKAPGASRLALRFAQISERWGRTDDAMAAYNRVLATEPRNAAAQLSLAALMEARGDAKGALILLGKNPTPDAEARVALLHAKGGASEEAAAALDRIAAPQNVWPAINVAAVLREKGERKVARAMLQSALVRNSDPHLRFPLQSSVVESLVPGDGEAVIGRELRRLREIASEQPELLGSYFEVAKKQSARLGVADQFARELAAAWADGAGSVTAGLALLPATVERGDRQGTLATLDRLLARDDVTEVWLQRVADLLQKANRDDLAARVFAQLAQMNPADDGHVLDCAQALRKGGRADEARTMLSRLDAVALIDDELAARLARGYAALGENARAGFFFQQALRGDPVARNYRTHLDFARFQTSVGDFAGARRTLRLAFGNSSNSEFDEIVAWLAASGQLENFETEAEYFCLAPARFTQLRRTVFAHYEAEGDFGRALAVVEAHPEAVEPGMAARLRSMAQMQGDFARVATVLEKFAARPDPPDVAEELARLYGDWAQADLAADRTEDALAHLRQAQKARPGLFDIAHALAEMQEKRGDRPGAIETLQAYLGIATDAADAAKAREFLAQLKSVAQP